MSLHIELRLFASLRGYAPPNAEAFPIRAGVSVAEIAAGLGIPGGEVRLVFVDGVRRDAQVRLRGGERVAVFPPIGGG